MNEPNLKPGERLDGLPSQAVTIIQNPDMFAYSLDAVLLAYFANPNKKGRGLSVDLGAGTGAVGLFYAKKVPGQVQLVEIQEDLAKMAKRSVALNEMEDRVSVIHSDMQAVFDQIKPGSVDTVLCNPPYFPVKETTKQNVDEHYQIARHEVAIDLPKLAQTANKLLKNKGKFFLVHRPERLADIFAALTARGLQVKHVQFVYGKSDREANMVLVEAIKQGRPGGVRVLPPIVAYTKDNQYTKQVQNILYGAPWTLES
ncbi:tRNA1(Val) (adenine(37)-N6)-methyltransferase [Fructobacillus sp. M1-13]|uniref:tRNA1(Val) (Adenine(37)-N6)-methyltransferase n=1 Tax=Fructobacillus papyriferae TaxID=2713171 RepID=A0ABS5QNQ2_9LACO|nr:tRNA1(Val) (adenine(37)-N6)-methyltransferase [Fructobacillus papyriferae]MBS9334759.1 tRNA1(Val) (adenine(37)-N6)-methyltransferase [Fructobacillus papyriferae]MCD2158749.1 tRNA1(Val) (adenine(37)-N6)-methyltransferase [Fructobacillus papyriferae]